MSDSVRMPPFQSLVVFEVAARHLSFTIAAQELNSTQPAVSQQIRALEAFLELTLFVRIYRGVELTHEGRVLFEGVQKGLNTIKTTLFELQKSQRIPRINVATDFAFAAFWLMPRLPEFRKMYPSVDIRIQTSQNRFDLNPRETDVAILFGYHDLAEKGFPQSCRLLQEKVFPVCSPSLLDKTGPIKSMKKLTSLPLLKLYTESDYDWMDWKTFLQARSSALSPGEAVMEFNNYTLLIQAAIAGHGIGLGWDHLVDDMLEKKFLVPLYEFSVETEQGYFLMLQPKSMMTEELSCFVDWLMDTVQKESSLRPTEL